MLAHNDLAVVFLVVVNQSVVVCARASLVALFVYAAARSRPVAIHDVPLYRPLSLSCVAPDAGRRPRILMAVSDSPAAATRP